MGDSSVTPNLHLSSSIALARLLACLLGMLHFSNNIHTVSSMTYTSRNNTELYRDYNIQFSLYRAHLLHTIFVYFAVCLASWLTD